MDKFSGKFELKMIDRNHTWVRYTAFSDPGGFAPAFVVKGVIRKVTFDTARNSPRMARDPKYTQRAEHAIAKSAIEMAIAQGSLRFSPSVPTGATQSTPKKIRSARAHSGSWRLHSAVRS